MRTGGSRAKSRGLNQTRQRARSDDEEPRHEATQRLTGENVFEIDTAGTETVLHTFTGYPTDGELTSSGVSVAFRGKVGDFYGETITGGAYGQGVVYKISTKGKEKLHSFRGGKQGANPDGGLIGDGQGNLYGTTQYGGTGVGNACIFDGCGTVFKLDKDFRETVLYSFTGTNGDGSHPNSGLIMDAAGNLYGTTQLGGAKNEGTVFELSPSGQETVLYSFCALSGCADGYVPSTGLVRDAAGNLYGTTTYGGASGLGVVYKITP